MEPTKVASSQGTQGAQGTQPAHTARAKSASQPAAPDAGGPAAAGGFLALLAALGDGADAGGALTAGGADALAADGPPDPAATGVDVSALAAWQGLWGALPGDGAQPAVGGMDGGARLNSAWGTGGAGGLGGVGGAAGVAGGLASGTAGAEWMPLGRSQGLVAETVMLDSAADMKDALSSSAAPAGGRALSRLQGGVGPRAGLPGAGEVGAGQGALGELKPALRGHAAVSAALSQALSERAPQAVAAGLHASERADGQRATPAGAEGSTPVADGLWAAVASARAPESSAGGRFNGEGAANGGSWSEGASGASPVEAGHFADAPAFTDPAAPGAEEQVAEQVAYWVNQKTQNAELTLQRDGQPVEVSVSLSGNEAHVSFRSDQPQTRELLDQSMAQLSDLLRSEGLVLSGMSVGTSARDGGGGREAGQQRPRDGVRQAQVVSAAAAGTPSLRRGGGAADRAIDIFV